jgi:hypothetical protein
LPLTAIAIATPAPPKKRVSLLAICVAAFGLFWVIAYALDADTKAKDKAALATFTADLQPGGKLATPAAFQTACGRADGSDRYKDITGLAYGDVRVYFRPGHAVDLRRATDYRNGGTFHDVEMPIGEDIAFEYLQCKGAL